MSDIQDDTYVSKDAEGVPVERDSALDETTEQDPNSDAQIGKFNFFLGEHLESNAVVAQDEKDAIDEDNIVDERTRGAKPKTDYTEKEEDDLSQEALELGTSSP